MPPPIPSAPIGISLLRASSSMPELSINLFCDLICPFSAKQFLVVQRELVPHLNQTNPGEVDIKLFFVPQPWHPQSGTLTEGALSVQREKQEATVQFIERLYDQREHFTDDKLYDSSRRDIYHKLVDIAEQVGVSEDAFLKNLELTEGGTSVTPDLKFYAKYHRMNSIHVTPTVVVNGIQDPSISSSFTKEDWINYLKEKFSLAC